MAVIKFNHVRVSGIKTVVPERYIDIDDEIQYFGNNPKKLARQKNMIGYGRRYVAGETTTVVDMACDAADRLLAEMQIDRDEIGLLVFVNQKPDYVVPCDACIAHGRLNLQKNCITLDVNLGCSGWVHGLLSATSILASGAIKKAVVLAGDIPARDCPLDDRKSAPVFGDAASATILEYTSEDCQSTFVCGSDGKGWDKIVQPYGGAKLPHRKDTIEASVVNEESGAIWHLKNGIMRGEDVFNFTMEVVPPLIQKTLKESGWSVQEVGCFSIHQANKQILETIVERAGIPKESTPVDVFSRYANNSTNSVVTVLCDKLEKRATTKAIVVSFGVGLSWGAAALDFKGLYNGGVATYVEKNESREDIIKRWTDFYQNKISSFDESVDESPETR